MKLVSEEQYEETKKRAAKRGIAVLCLSFSGIFAGYSAAWHWALSAFACAMVAMVSAFWLMGPDLD